MELLFETGKGERAIRNAVDEAVYIVLGGITPASNYCFTSNQRIQHVVKMGIVRSAQLALRLERETEKRGQRVPMDELAGEAPWSGPDRHPDLPRRNGSNGGGPMDTTRCNASLRPVEPVSLRPQPAARLAA